MLLRWLRRRGWMRSGGFDRDVQAACDEMTHFYGGKALETARRKLARPRQRVSRRLVWQAVVARLEAEAASESTNAPNPCGDIAALSGTDRRVPLPAASEACASEDPLPPVFQ